MTKSQWSSSSAASTGKVLWNGNWVTFLDTLLHMIILAETGRSLRLPTRIRSVCIDPVLHKEQVCQYQDSIEGNVSRAWAFASCFCCSVGECDFLRRQMDLGGPLSLQAILQPYNRSCYSAALVTVWHSTVHLITLNKILVVFDASLRYFPVFQLLMLLWTAVLIALKQEAFTSMVFTLLWHHDDNRNGSLPPWKDSALCPILRVTVCLPVPIFTPIWSIAKVEGDWFCHSRGILQPGKNAQEKPFILLQNIQEIVLVLQEASAPSLIWCLLCFVGVFCLFLV